MDILYTTNDKFIPKVGTSICSVFENNKEAKEINIYILGQEITEDNRKKLLDMAVSYGRNIEVIEIESLKQNSHLVHRKKA